MFAQRYAFVTRPGHVTLCRVSKSRGGRLLLQLTVLLLVGTYMTKVANMGVPKGRVPGRDKFSHVRVANSKFVELRTTWFAMAVRKGPSDFCTELQPAATKNRQDPSEPPSHCVHVAMGVCIRSSWFIWQETLPVVYPAVGLQPYLGSMEHVSDFFERIETLDLPELKESTLRCRSRQVRAREPKVCLTGNPVLEIYRTCSHI